LLSTAENGCMDNRVQNALPGPMTDKSTIDHGHSDDGEEGKGLVQGPLVSQPRGKAPIPVFVRVPLASPVRFARRKHGKAARAAPPADRSQAQIADVQVVSMPCISQGMNELLHEVQSCRMFFCLACCVVFAFTTNRPSE